MDSLRSGHSLTSRPSRARGLKGRHKSPQVCVAQSRPSRARGLKASVPLMRCTSTLVAPLAGAWIESQFSLLDAKERESRAPRGRVD